MSELHHEDNYLPCDRYQVQLPGEDGFARWQEPDNGQWYFAYYALDEVVLRSEGYVSEDGRDNGIESVKRYKDADSNYRTTLQPDGKWVLELIAGNQKEIARSCRYDTEAEARMRLPGSIEARAAMAAPHPHQGREDDYLACKDYMGHARRSDHRHFSTFEKDGEYYFAYLAEDGDVLLRSEGYQSYEARDRGMDSVQRNVHDPKRYKVIEKMDYFFVVLTAPNHKEIARSCNLGHAAALAHISRLVGEPVSTPSATASTEPAAAEPAGSPKDSMAWLWWLLPLVLLGVLYGLWKGCN